MKYKIGDKIILITDIWKVHVLSSYGLEKGKTYKIIKIINGYYNIENPETHKNFGGEWNSLFIEDETVFKLVNRKMKLERLLK